MTTEKIVQLSDGGFLNARADGPDGAHCVVMSNSVLTSLTLWDAQIPALSSQVRILRYDQRGHGRSSTPDGPLDFNAYGADLLALLDAFDIDRCIFVGLSMGTPTGLAAYGAAPERFGGFVAVDGVARSAPGREAFWADRRALALTDGMEALARDTARRWMPGSEPESDAVGFLERMIADTPVDGFAAATHALSIYDYSSVVPTLDCPFLALCGERDGAMPEAMRRQFERVRNARFASIPAAGHLPNYQAPDAFNTLLLEFLDAAIASDNREAS